MTIWVLLIGLMSVHEFKYSSQAECLAAAEQMAPLYEPLRLRCVETRVEL